MAERKTLLRVILAATLVFALALGLLLTALAFAERERPARIERALRLGNTARAEGLIARLPEGEERTAYENRCRMIEADALARSGDYRGAAALYASLGSFEGAEEARSWRRATTPRRSAALTRWAPSATRRNRPDARVWPRPARLRRRGASTTPSCWQTGSAPSTRRISLPLSWPSGSAASGTLKKPSPLRRTSRARSSPAAPLSRPAARRSRAGSSTRAFSTPSP